MALPSSIQSILENRIAQLAARYGAVLLVGKLGFDQAHAASIEDNVTYAIIAGIGFIFDLVSNYYQKTKLASVLATTTITTTPVQTVVVNPASSTVVPTPPATVNVVK